MSKRKIKSYMKQLTLLQGTSIMVHHGSPEFKSAPYVSLKGTNWEGKPFEQKTNILAFIPFERSVRRVLDVDNDGNPQIPETAHEHITRDMQNHRYKVNEASKSFAGWSTYYLDKVRKTSKTILYGK